jgi:predicted nucleic acid-binding protein
MILLDTNYLIRMLVAGTAEAQRMHAWLENDTEFCTSSVAWYEFVCGPVDAEGVSLVQAILADRILPFSADQGSEAARLFNAVGRQRRLRVDAMIAACAIVANAELATGNTADFTVFCPHGLRLAP